MPRLLIRVFRQENHREPRHNRCYPRAALVETIEGIIDRAVMLQNGRLVTIEPGAGSLRERFRLAVASGFSRKPGPETEMES